MWFVDSRASLANARATTDKMAGNTGLNCQRNAEAPVEVAFERCVDRFHGSHLTVSIGSPKGYLGGSTGVHVHIDGGTINWFVSQAASPVAATDVGVASAATVTCAAPWWTTEAAGTGALFGAGGTVGGVTGSISGGGGGGSRCPGEPRGVIGRVSIDSGIRVDRRGIYT
jgi:hypothetical protein